MRSPQPDEESNFKSRFHVNAFYFPTGDSNKDSGLEIEFMIDTGAACSIINYRTFSEISKFLQPITVVRSKQKTRTYTGEEIPMLGHTTLTFSFDSDGEHCFQLQLWITETKTANLLGIEFCRKYISKLHFDIPALELKDTPNTICYGSLCATKLYPYLSLVRTVRIPHQIHVDAKTSRVYKYRPGSEQTNFAPGTTFIPHQKVSNSGLDFVNVLCTQSEGYLAILMENNKNHQITLDKGILGYSALDILDFERPKYQVKDCVKWWIAYYLKTISTTNVSCYIRPYHTKQTLRMGYASSTVTMIQSLKVRPPLPIAYQRMQK